MKRSMQAEGSHRMGDKGGKKDKDIAQNQKAVKHEHEAQKKQEKQPRRTP